MRDRDRERQGQQDKDRDRKMNNRKRNRKGVRRRKRKWSERRGRAGIEGERRQARRLREREIGMRVMDKGEISEEVTYRKRLFDLVTISGTVLIISVERVWEAVAEPTNNQKVKKVIKTGTMHKKFAKVVKETSKKPSQPPPLHEYNM